MNRNRVRVLFTLAGCLLVSGCGPSLIKPSGRITQNGNPVPLKKGEHLAITLYPVDRDPASYDPFQATVNADHSFYFVGRKGKGIPPDKYRLTIELNKGDSEKDLWNGKYGPAKSPFVYDLNTHRGEILIDLAEAKPEKN